MSSPLLASTLKPKAPEPPPPLIVNMSADNAPLLALNKDEALAVTLLENVAAPVEAIVSLVVLLVPIVNSKLRLSSNRVPLESLLNEKALTPSRIPLINGFVLELPIASSVIPAVILGVIPISSNLFLPTFDNGSNFIYKKREYFGPVDISRITIKLVNQKGNIVNLHKTDYSFSLQIRSLYNLTNTGRGLRAPGIF